MNWWQTNPNLDFKRPLVGVMIEVPALLYQLDAIAPKVDFFSVGTNDLTQYMLAVESATTRAWRACTTLSNPGMFACAAAHYSTLYRIAQAGERLWGNGVGDPGGAILLVAMGYRSLSMSTHNLDKIRWILRHLDSKMLQVLLTQVMSSTHPDQVRRLLAN